MERSFARSTRYGFDRAQWRSLWRVQIQEYLVCALQNIQVLIGYGRDPKKRAAMVLRLEAGREQLLQPIRQTLFANPSFFFQICSEPLLSSLEVHAQ